MAAEAPSTPWGAIVLGVLALCGVIYLIKVVSGIFAFLLSVVVLVVIVLVVRALFMGPKT
jgi:hypothetical protein